MHAPSTRSSLSASQDYELGRLSANDATQDRRLARLEERDEKRKAEVDQVKTWLERAFFLALLLVTGLLGHTTSPLVGGAIGAAMRALVGLRAG